MSWVSLGFPCSPVGKESACSAGDLGSIPGLGRSPGEGNGNPLQYPCLENFMDRGAWWAAVHGVAQSQARLSITYLRDHITGKRDGCEERENSISFYSAVLLGLSPLRPGQPFQTMLTIYRRPASMLPISWEQVYPRTNKPAHFLL